MIEAIFLRLFNVSIMASWLVAAIIVLRLLFKKMPKAIVVIMWGFVGIRLIIPISIESNFSVIPSEETVPENIIYKEYIDIQSDNPVINSAIEPIVSDPYLEREVVDGIQILISLVTMVWPAGVMGLLGYAIVSYLVIYLKVRESIPLRDNIYICDDISTPFILGILRPRIYLPSNIAQEDIEYVVAHEKAHLKRFDHWWKPLGFLILAIYCFNPVIWIGYILLCRDIESACDEKVLMNMGESIKKSYSTALINCSVPQKVITACPLAFGEIGVKSRVKSVLHYKKPAFWIVVAAVISCIGVGVCFLTNPITTVGSELSDVLEDDELAAFIDSQIIARNHYEKSEKYYCCADYDILGIEEKSDRITVYMWVLYGEYLNENGLEMMSGNHIPTVITVEKKEEYQLVEYWEPRDGEYYGTDIRAKFPKQLWAKALDSQRNIAKQSAILEKKAKEYFGIGEDDVNVYGYYSCPVGNTGKGFEKMVEIGDSYPGLFYISSVCYCPFIQISSVDELKAFMQSAGTVMNFEQSYPDALSFNMVSATYTEKFFEKKTLFLVYVGAGTTANRYSLEYAKMVKDTLSFGIVEEAPQVGDTALQGWLVCVHVFNEELVGVKNVDARISSSKRME